MASPRIKRYLYISQTKVDLGFDQIEEPLLKRIAAELKVELPPVALSVGARPPRDTLVRRMRIVLAYLEKSEPIGTIDAPAPYFRGTMSMVEAEIGGKQPILLYAGRAGTTLVALTGSLPNSVGERRAAEQPGSRVASLEKALDREDAAPAPQRRHEKSFPPDIRAIDRRVAWVLRRSWHMLQDVEFVAERLKSTALEQGEDGAVRFLHGTPLYVALSD